MNWNKLLTPEGLLDTAIGAVLVLLGIYKKEAQEGFKAFFAWCWTGLLGWLRRLVHRGAGQEAALKEVEAMLTANMRGLTTLLLLIQKDYKPDRVSITEYEVCSDGSAHVTCVVEVREAEMQSVTDLQATPLPKPLWLEISRIPYLPGRALYVPDARTADSAAVQAALLASGAWSAYYQVMPDPKGEYQKFTMLALSWQTQHALTAADLHDLHNSGVTCATVLLTRSQAQQLKATLTGSAR
ncbi:hypothetical protein HHL22_20515 [Hymenobacter sp. RP-2-7]|uniref:Uncharacterized protein n=1 Tax=Hymenobacter polaris TaxID=2682546 RepID=A0A7Y0FPF7_9BACT|nr:hypothetical protein [Hymenobacter polaris]NML67591.1 hypothetical protein [Hymenobacter polaris]